MGRNGKTGRVIRNQERKARKSQRPKVQTNRWIPMSGAMAFDRSAFDQAIYHGLRQDLYFNHAPTVATSTASIPVSKKMLEPIGGTPRTRNKNGSVTYHFDKTG